MLYIFSFLPAPYVFRSVSLVCKDFRRLAYDRQIVTLGLEFIREISLGKKGSLHQEAVDKLLEVISVAPADIVTSLSLLNGKTTWESLSRFKKKCSNLLLLNLSGAKGHVPENVITFARLRELNVSGTSIDNHFLSQLSRTCKHLYCLNIARCLNVAHEGILQSSFNLAVINMAYCLLGGESIIHAINKYDCTIVCTRGMPVTSDSASTIAMLFPDVLEIGIPIICGFSFSGSSCPNVCCWCSGNDLTRNLLSLESCLNPFIQL